MTLFDVPAEPPDTHPAKWSPEILAVIAPTLRAWGLPVHDCFAGTGQRLARLCDQLGLAFTGTDIESWPGADSRVVLATALDATTYPVVPFAVVTSPVYANKRFADYRNGPTSTTNTKGRRDYGIALGQALHPDNLARLTGRPALENDYYREHAKAVKHWSDRVLLNVDSPIADRWVAVLTAAGYTITDTIPVHTRRYRGLDNADARADHETVIIGTRDMKADTITDNSEGTP